MMGVKNWGFIHYRRHNLDEISPRVIAIDAPNYLIRRIQAFEYRSGGTSERVPSSHVYVVLGIIRSFLRNNLMPVFVFDGPPESLKRETNPRLVSCAQEAYDRYQTRYDIYDAKLTHELWESRPLRWYFSVLHVKDLCKSIGVPAFTAPSEAEMMAAAICNNGLSGTVLSNDVDALLFGSPTISCSIRVTDDQIESAKLGEVLHEIDVDIHTLRDLAILSGCDFHEGVKGIGPRKGIVILRRFGSLERVLKSLGFKVHERNAFLEARTVFNEADSLPISSTNLNLNAPIESKIIDILFPIMGSDKAEKEAKTLVRIWKEFGQKQETLERWT